MKALPLAALLLAAAAPLAFAQAARAAGPEAPAAPAGPVIGAWGFDVDGMDPAVRPGDDFYAHASGAWDRANPIPEDRAQFGMFHHLRDLSQTRTRAILDDLAASESLTGPARKAGDYYASYRDEARIEALGLAPLKPRLDAIAAIATRAQLASALGEANALRSAIPLRVGIGQDLKDPSKMVASVYQSGLGMPNRDYYLEEKFAETAAAYEAHVARMLALAGYDAPAERAARVIGLERAIAQAHWTPVETRQADRRHNPVAVADLAARYPGVDWSSFLSAAGLSGQTEINIGQPSAIAGTAKLVEGHALEAWRDYLAYHALRAAADVLPKSFQDEAFAFHGTRLNGTPKIEERWKRAVDATSSALGEAVGEVYVARHFPPEAKAQMDALVRNILAVMDDRLANLAWMDKATREKARAKLARFTPKIGYPEVWRDYSDLTVVRGDALGNLERAARFDHARNLAKLGKPIDRREWFMTPMTVNAYANFGWNEIVFPAAILQAPFFDPKADPAVNYGGIGAVIGHEILHHFDDQGRKFDPDGKLADWWSPADVERFGKLADKVVAQYGAYEPLPGKPVNGRLALGENIADLAGLSIAHEAWQRSLGGKPAPDIDGKSGDQRFFLGFAQIWRSKYRESALERQLAVGPHTPSHFRARVVRNHDAWYKAFDVKPGDALYLPEDERIRIW